MHIKFRIEDVFPADRQVIVRYFTDAFPEGSTLAVTIYPEPMPTGDDLHDYIMSYAPTAWLLVKDKVARLGASPLEEAQVLKVAKAHIVREVDPDGLVVPKGLKNLNAYNRRKGILPPGAI